MKRTAHVALQITDAQLLALSVTPAAPRLVRGSAVQLFAVGVFSDQTKQDLTASVTWTSSSDAVATVSTTGLAKAVSGGTATLTATLGPVTGAAELTVTDATLVSLEVSPGSATLARGTTQQLAGTGLFDDGSKQDLTANATWASSDSAVASVDTAGLARALKVGTTTLSATLAGVSGSATLEVTAARLTALEVTPAVGSLAKGTTLSFTATGLFSDQSKQDLTGQVTWAAADASVAAVSSAPAPAGLARGLGVGTTSVSASLGAVTGSAQLTVTAATLVSLEIAPGTASLPAGLTQAFTATGVFSDQTKQDLTASVAWTTSDAAVAAVGNAAGSAGVASALKVDRDARGEPWGPARQRDARGDRGDARLALDHPQPRHPRQGPAPAVHRHRHLH